MMPSTICGFYGAPEQICSETVVSVISVEPFYARHNAAGNFRQVKFVPKFIGQQKDGDRAVCTRQSKWLGISIE
jgi:hypothetical protein